MRTNRPTTRLPAWTYIFVIASALLAYFAVGQLLHAPDFLNDLGRLLASEGSLDAFDSERLAPLVLLMIPAILGGIGTRALIARLFDGLRRGESPRTLAMALGGMLLSVLVYVLLAIYSSGRERR
jgi:hypothetical protein